jgi:16S rRNA processing protein RimM
MARQQDSKRICVARIGAAHGVRGDVKLWSFTADPLAIADYGVLETQDGRRSFEIETLRPQGDFLVARLAGVSDRNAAEALRNIDLYVSRNKFPDIVVDDEFYVADLVGLAACDPAGATIGEVVGVHNFGAGDLIELKLTAARDTLLLPFSEANVLAIDIAGGKVTVALPAEIEAPPEGRE